MASRYRINPKYRAYGKARIDIARRVKDQADWDTLWIEPAHPFPFTWDADWRQCTEYKVDDYAAEIGFFIDILGLSVNAFGTNYAMFTSPGGDFFLGVAAAEDEASTPPDALRFQFSVADLIDTFKELKRRGIAFDQEPQPCEAGSQIYLASFRTPHGVCIDLMGEVEDGEQE